MARLWRYAGLGAKYLVLRRDGTIPTFLHFVLGSRDPASSVGLRAYADEAERLGYDQEYVADVRTLADEYEADLAANGPGDPDAGPHRKDCEAIVELIKIQSGGS